MATLYNIIFGGQVAPGNDPVSVKEAMKNLLKLDADGIEHIFAGRPISLKKGVNASTAEKYRKAIETAGALCEVEPMADED